MKKMNVKIDNIELSTSIIELNETSDPNIKTATMLIHKCDIPNGNGLDFKLGYTEEFMNTLVDKPVVTKYYEFKDDLGSHEAVFDENGRITELKTIAIGTITDVWIDDYKLEDGTVVKALFAKATLWSYKYPKIIACIENLFSEGKAESSVEVAIYEWGDDPSPTQEYRYATKFTYLANCLLGSTVEPADDSAGIISLSHKEISKAVWEDTKVSEVTIPEQENYQEEVITNEVNESIDIVQEKKEGGQVIVSEKDENKKIEVAENKGYKVTYKGVLETCDLTFDQIYSYVYNLLNPVDTATGYRNYNYWIDEIYPNYVVAVDWDYDNVAYRIGYTVSDDIVSIVSKDQWVKGRLGFIPDGVSNDDLLSAQLDEDEDDQQIEDLTNQVNQLTTTVQDLQSQVDDYKSQVDDLTQQLADVTAERDQLKQATELAEKEKTKEDLNNKYSKLLSKEVFTSERVQNAINNVDEATLKDVVVEELASKTNVTEKTNETVVVNAKQQEDLLPSGKYDYLFKSKQD